MKQALAPGNSTTFDQLQLVITRTRHGEGLGIAMRDEGVAGEFDVVVWQVNRSMRAYGIIREGDRVLTIGGALAVAALIGLSVYLVCFAPPPEAKKRRPRRRSAQNIPSDDVCKKVELYHT